MYQLNDGESRGVTLRQVWTEYRKARDLSEATIRSYSLHLEHYLIPWLDVPIESITKEQALRLHSDLTSRFSGGTANCSLRIARALITWGIYRFDLNMNLNPVCALSKLRVWNKESRRSGYIPEERMADWFQAVQQEPNTTARQYLLFLMQTGLRRREAASLEWRNVDFAARTFLIEKTKNGDPHKLPLSEYCHQLLAGRRASNPRDLYVFSTEDGLKPFTISPLAVKRIEWELDLSFHLHDLRRTYVTIGESLDLNFFLLKRLMNHRQSSDITASYIQTSVNRLREPCERISSRIVQLWE